MIACSAVRADGEEECGGAEVPERDGGGHEAVLGGGQQLQPGDCALQVRGRAGDGHPRDGQNI